MLQKWMIQISEYALVDYPERISTLSRYRRGANRTHGLPWAFKRHRDFCDFQPVGHPTCLDPDQPRYDASIESSVANRLLAMMRCAGRSAFFSIPFGLVCLATVSPNAGIFSPGAPPNQRNGPSDKVSGSKNNQRMQAEGRSSSLTLAVTSARRAPL